MVIIGNCGGSDYGTNDAGPHAVLTADDIDYTYDDVGNMVTATDASSNTTTYGYDDLYHLTGVDFPTGSDLAMVYDADGTRVSRTEGDTTITYVGGLFEVEDDGTTTVRTHYTFGGDHIAVRVDDGTTDTLTYQFGDHLGSVATTYQAGTAGTTSRYLHYYYPYGEPRGTQTEYPSDHTYTGQIDDPGGLMYYRARYYQPAIGRFTQPDTIAPDPGNSQDYNRYMYVRGNPINRLDPTGHDDTCIAPIDTISYMTGAEPYYYTCPSTFNPFQWLADVGHWIWENRDWVALGAAVAVCFAQPEACGIAFRIAGGIGAEKAIDDYGFTPEGIALAFIALATSGGGSRVTRSFQKLSQSFDDFVAAVAAEGDDFMALLAALEVAAAAPASYTAVSMFWAAYYLGPEYLVDWVFNEVVYDDDAEDQPVVDEPVEG